MRTRAAPRTPGRPRPGRASGRRSSPIRASSTSRRPRRTTSAARRSRGRTGRCARRRSRGGGRPRRRSAGGPRPDPRMAETRAAISRSVRSESARRAISARDRSSSSMSRALAIAIGGLVGERARQTGIGLVEGVGPVRVGVDDAEDVVAVDQRRGEHRVDPGLADEGVAIGRVLEPLVLEVVAGPRRGRVRMARPETPTSGSMSTLSSRSRLASSAPGRRGPARPRPCPARRSGRWSRRCAWRRRAAASMTDWRISPWSRIALTRPAISRSVRSASAVRASWARERPARR